MDKNIDWSKAPKGTVGAMVAKFDSTEKGGCTFFGKVEFVSGHEVQRYSQGPEAWVYIERPTEAPEVPAIKSLEQRIKDRAISRLADDLEVSMRDLVRMAGNQIDKPSGVGELTIKQVIDAAGSAIMKARSPQVADYALNRALDRLAEHVDTAPLRMIGLTSTPSASGK